jgi:proteasome alpha subunit
VLFCAKRIFSPFIIPEYKDYVFNVDEHVGVATSGLVADARQLVGRARVEAQINRITYADKVPVDVLVKRICDFKQSFTQYGGSRPFGTALLLGGVDDEGIHLYETDPSGAYQSYHAGAIGSGRNTVIEYFEDKWKEGLTLNAAMKLGLEALRHANDGQLNREAVEVATITADGYSVLDREAVNKQIDRLKPLDD